MKRILIYRLGSLGDTCVALPALKVIRVAHPDARITLLTNLPVHAKAAAVPALLAGTGLVDDYLSYPVGTRSPVRLLRLIIALRQQRCDAVVNLAAWRGVAALRRDIMFFRLAGFQRFVGFDPDGAHELRRGADGLAEHEAQRLLRRVAELGQAELDDRWWFDLSLSNQERAKAELFVRRAGVAGAYLAFSLGTKVPANDWGADNWKELLRRVGQACPGLGCVAVGSADEATRTADCLAGWPGAKGNLCGRLDPRLSGAVLSRAAVFVGHDSGPIHLAASVGTRCVGVYGARNPPGQWFPFGPGHHVFHLPVSCAGCGLETCGSEGKRCLTGIAAENVAAAVLDQINARHRAITAGAGRNGR